MVGLPLSLQGQGSRAVLERIAGGCQPWQDTAVWGAPPATGREGPVPGSVGPALAQAGTSLSPHPWECPLQPSPGS